MSVEYETLESMCELVVDCPHSTPKWTDEGFLVLRNQNIRNGVLDLSSPSFTNQEDYEGRIRRAVPQASDIVFTREAPMGEVCMIPEGLQCCLGQRQVLLRPKKSVNGEYLFWALQSPFVQHQISWNEGTGSTVSNVRIPVLKALKIPRNGSAEAAIAKVLSDIASKIENNRQTNQTLERIAQAIFKSWFVDFEPTRAKIIAKAQGADPATQELAAQAIISGAITLEQLQGYAEESVEESAQQREQESLSTRLQKAINEKLSQPSANPLNATTAEQLIATAALFPNELVESELGEVPEGWELKALDEIAHYQNGLALQKFRPENDEESLPVLKIAQLRKGFADGEERASANIKPECIVDNGDVVFSWSGSLIVDIWCGGKVALNQHLFKVTSQNYPKWFYHYWTKRHLEVFQQIARSEEHTSELQSRPHLV